MDHYILIIILMIGAGLLGGITNYFRIEQEKKDLFSFSKMEMASLWLQRASL